MRSENWQTFCDFLCLIVFFLNHFENQLLITTNVMECTNDTLHVYTHVGPHSNNNALIVIIKHLLIIIHNGWQSLFDLSNFFHIYVYYNRIIFTILNATLVPILFLLNNIIDLLIFEISTQLKYPIYKGSEFSFFHFVN